MNWHELYDVNNVPTLENIRTYIGEAKSNWDELVLYIEKSYSAKQQLDFSKCSAQPGWNVKYRKSGKSLCTLYPMPNYFIALIVVGAKEEQEVDLAMEARLFSEYVKGLYQKTTFSSMGKWLMIEVRNEEVLTDIKHLMEIRMRSI